HVGVVVAEPGQAVEHSFAVAAVAAVAAGSPAADPAGVPPFGDEEVAVVVAEAVDGGAQTAEVEHGLAIRFDAPEAAAGRRAGEGEAGLGDPGGAVGVEGHAG